MVSAASGGLTKWQLLWKLRRFGFWALASAMGPIQGGFDLLAGQQVLAMVTIFTSMRGSAANRLLK